MAERRDRREEPLNIYELHLGSWRRKEDGGWYRYDELAQPLIDYMKECGYNYVEFLPLSEHPCDESWGYQITGFYAPTSRYGTARELMMLIDRLHQAGIGVILDFVPAHFAVDDYGLARYDGTRPLRVSPPGCGGQRVGEPQLHALPRGGALFPPVLRPVLAGGVPL